MNQFGWNNLRSGDAVVVHDPVSSCQPPAPAVVERVAPRRQGNRVLVRLTSGGNRRLWPSRLVVHRAGGGDAAECWRCVELAGTS